MSPAETHELLRRLWEREWRILSLIFGPGGATLLGVQVTLAPNYHPLVALALCNVYRSADHPFLQLVS
jgi:hypothetical protein